MFGFILWPSLQNFVILYHYRAICIGNQHITLCILYTLTILINCSLSALVSVAGII